MFLIFQQPPNPLTTLERFWLGLFFIVDNIIIMIFTIIITLLLLLLLLLLIFLLLLSSPLLLLILSLYFSCNHGGYFSLSFFLRFGFHLRLLGCDAFVNGTFGIVGHSLIELHSSIKVVKFKQYKTFYVVGYLLYTFS